MENPPAQDQAKKYQSSKNDAAVEVAATSSQPRATLQEYERLFGVDEDAYEQPTTTRKELWSYYLYYNGRVSLGILECMGI